MGDTIVRQWMVLSMLPAPPRRIDAASIEARLRDRGVDVHRRTIQRDLVELSQVFPLVADLRSKPYGWRWAEANPFATAPRDPMVRAPAGSGMVAPDVGQRSATETLFGIIAAFIEKRTWTQADLARRLETRPETIRRRLNELAGGGFKLEREDDHPHVYWSVPKDWFPGALVFKPDEVADLVRLMARAPRGQLRERQLALVVTRLANLGQPKAPLDPDAVRPPEVAADEERWLAIIEDAAARKLAVKMRYFTASRRIESWRHVSVHRIDIGLRSHFIATCHNADALRRFRLSSISAARLDQGEPFRATTKAALERFDRESFGGFHDDGPLVTCEFVVRDAEAAWVARNLPDGTVAQDRRSDGVLFRVETSAVNALARFVVGLGEAARPETPELAERVRALAGGALANATRP